jgi:hypothetical protein
LPNFKKKDASIIVGRNLSPIAFDFNENWNTKLHGPIATKNI